LQDFTSNANDFRHQSGAYELVLVVGDALLQNAFAWKLHDQIQLSFHEESLLENSHQILYQPKKEIIHQFREDEKRPSTTVSLIFSALTLLPLLVLLVSVSEHLLMF
jgi:oligosaccharyltransferase complex subunit delta (ribophorin II)